MAKVIFKGQPGLRENVKFLKDFISARKPVVNPILDKSLCKRSLSVTRLNNLIQHELSAREFKRETDLKR